MKYYCDPCDKPVKLKSKNKHLQTLTHNDFQKRIRIKHTIENSDFFETDEIFDVYNTNHNKEFGLYLVIYYFIFVFDKDFYPQVISDFQYKTMIFPFKQVLLGCIESFSERGKIFTH